MYSKVSNPPSQQKTTTMKDHLTLVFQKPDGSLKPVSFSIPVPVAQRHDYQIPPGTKLKEVLIKGGRIVDRVFVSGKPDLGSPKMTVPVDKKNGLFFCERQRFTLKTPLADEINIAFEVSVESRRGKDITNCKLTDRRPSEKQPTLKTGLRAWEECDRFEIELNAVL
ncbi:MAG: hypothetical protein QG585_206 [Patescibacteria group bacterium]|jgi:hypothetical protein|nr:hypothetical protein [Patescibacteria group bacterium]